MAFDLNSLRASMSHNAVDVDDKTPRILIDKPGEVKEEIPISKLHTFRDHPFNVTDDEEMDEFVATIKAEGVITPIIVRRRKDGDYEIISGHRRTHAAERAGLKTIPALIREMDDGTALKIMRVTNKQRSVKPSEWAKAYRMELDYAKEHSGIEESRAIDRLAAETGLSTDKLYRYIRLSKLIPALLALVDAGQISITPAAQLSQLDDEAQNIVLNAIQKTHCPNMAQAEALNKHYRANGSLTLEDAIEIISGKKAKSAAKPATPKVSFKTIKHYFAKGTKEEDALALMQMLLEDYVQEHGQDGVIKL